MQKKIIALAVAGLVSGAAFAQSNVTVYGTIDMAYQYNGSSNIEDQDSYSALDDGGWDSSRFGLKGTEDLGNGLSANFTQEFDLAIDRSKGVSTRNSYVSLAGKSWGEVKLGSVGSVHDDYAGWSESGGMSYGNGVVDLIVTGDAKNAIEYVSPNFSGAQFKLGASSNYVNAQDSAGSLVVDADGDVIGFAKAENLRAYFASAAYANGGLKIALTYDNADQQNTDFSKDEWMIAGGYDFGMVKVGAAYDRMTAEEGSAEVTRDAYRLTIGAPIGASGNLALSYTNASLDANWLDNDVEADGFGISYSHFLSKRTALYAAAYTADADVGFREGAGDSGTPTPSAYETGFKVGVRHQF